MNSKQKPTIKQGGFTVIELMVVFLIIVTLSSLIIVNWNSQTPRRSLTIAQSETTTNIRKVQSYATSSRNINMTIPAKFYLLKFTKNSGTYSLDGSDSTANPVYYTNLETYNLSSGLIVSNIVLTQIGSSTTISPNCVMVVTSVIYAKTYFLPDICDSSALTTISTPALLASKSNYNLTLTLTHTQKNISKTITIYGLTGKVEAN